VRRNHTSSVLSARSAATMAEGGVLVRNLNQAMVVVLVAGEPHGARAPMAEGGVQGGGWVADAAVA
jgi:hypothetical protein